MKILIDIIKECISQGKTDYIVSITGENELLLYRKTGHDYRNVVIDADGYVEYIETPLDAVKTWNRHYPDPTKEDIVEIVNFL